MNDQQRHAAILPVSVELLREVLHLPAGTLIYNVRWSHEFPEVVELAVEHEDLDAVPQGDRLPFIKPTFGRIRRLVWFKKIFEVRFLGWGQR